MVSLQPPRWETWKFFYSLSSWLQGLAFLSATTLARPVPAVNTALSNPADRFYGQIREQKKTWVLKGAKRVLLPRHTASPPPCCFVNLRAQIFSPEPWLLSKRLESCREKGRGHQAKSALIFLVCNSSFKLNL